MEDIMIRKLFVASALPAIAVVMPVLWVSLASSAPSSTSACGTSYAPVLDPGDFVAVIDNPYFPLPVGRQLVYTGIKDGQTQTDTVIVTDQTKVILGITAPPVRDISTHDRKMLGRDA